MKHLLLITSVLVCSFLKAQDPAKGRLLVFIETPGVVMRLDSTLIKSSQKPVELAPGTYIFKAWAPTKSLYVDTIEIKAGKTSFVTNPLRNTPEYSNYKRNMLNYKLGKFGTLVVPAVATVAYSGIAFIRYNKNEKKMEDHLVNAQEAAKNYESAISLPNLTKYKDKYNEEKKAYEDARTENNKIAKRSMVIIPVGVVATVGLAMLSKKITKPVYNEPAPLLTLNTIHFTSDPQNVCSLGFQFNINPRK